MISTLLDVLVVGGIMATASLECQVEAGNRELEDGQIGRLKIKGGFGVSEDLGESEFGSLERFAITDFVPTVTPPSP
jgi:hypothetical protein